MGLVRGWARAFLLRFFSGRPEAVNCNWLRALLAGRRRAYVCQRIISSFCVGTAIRRNYTSIVHEFQNTTFKMFEERSRENSDLSDLSELSDVSALSDSSELSYSAVGHCDRRRYNRELTVRNREFCLPTTSPTKQPGNNSGLSSCIL